METKVDVLPSTESKKTCSLLSTDSHDSDVITKEREEELLNDDLTTCEEDIDEDEALSDDSLRLKLSDDDEAEQDDVDSSVYSFKPVKKEDSDEDKKYKTHESRLATSEEDKDSHQDNFSLQENLHLDKEEVKSKENCNIDQGQSIGTDDLNESKNISSTETAHDQDTIMNGKDPRFYPNSIRPMYENRWNPPNHRMRMGFNIPPLLPTHPRYFSNSNYNKSDVNDHRYYNKYKHYNNRGRGYPSYNKPRSEDRKKETTDVSSTLKVIDSNSSDAFANDDIFDDNQTSQEKKPKCENFAEKPTDHVANDKVDNADGKVDDISSNEQVLDSEKIENEKENINDCIADSAESLPDKTEEPTANDLPNSLKLDEENGYSEEAPVQSPSKLQEEDIVLDVNLTSDEAKSPNSAPINDQDFQKESADLVDNVIASDCGTGTSDNSDKLNKLDDNLEETVQTNETDLKLQCSNDDIENSEDNLEDMVIDHPSNGEEDLPKRNDNQDEEEKEKENSEESANIKDQFENNEAFPNLASKFPLNEDSDSTINKLPAVYQCLEEVANMETSRITEEIEKIDHTNKDILAVGENIKLQLSHNCEDDAALKDNPCDVNSGVNDNDNPCDDADKPSGDDENASKAPEQIDDDTMPYDRENEVNKETQEMLHDGADKNDADKNNIDSIANNDENVDEEEISNLTVESSESVVSSSKHITEDKENGLQDVEKMNFDDNACDANEDPKETNDDTEVTKDSETKSLFDSLIGQKSDIVMEDISSDKLNDVSNDVSNDISNDINYDISNDISDDVSNDVNSNDANVDVQIKLSDDDESSSRNSVATKEKVHEDIELKDDDSREEIANAADEAKKLDSSTNIEQIEEIIGLDDDDDEKMVIDENFDEPEVPSSDKETESSKTIADSSDGKLETSSMDISTKDSPSSEKKQENFLRLKSQTDDTLFAPKTSSVENKDGETSGRQKRKTAKNAEELIKNKFLKSDSEIDSDDSGKFVSVNYKKSKLLVSAPSSVSPSSLKRNLADVEDIDSETDLLARQVATKKLKMTIDSPKKLSELFFSFKKDSKKDNKDIKDAKIVLDVKDAKDTKDVKKVKDQESIRNLVNVRKFFQRDIKGKLKKLKQEELEDLLIQKIVETITMASEIGKLREQARLSEKNQEATRARCQQLAKQLQDFEMVLKRNAADRSASSDKFVPPIKINRSVGLQVNFISDHGMQNMRQIQQNAKSSSVSSSSSSTSTSSEVSVPHARKGIKVRSPRRSEIISPAGSTPTTPVQAQIPTSNTNPITPAAMVSTKPSVIEPPTRTMPLTLQSITAQQTGLSNVNIRSPNKISSIHGLQQGQQAVILNGNLNATRVTAANPITVQKPKASNDLIDLTDEEEKTKTAVNTPIAVTTATIISNHPQARGNIIQSSATSGYQRVIQVPSSVALSGQTANIRVVQPNSQTTPTALVNNINASRMFVMQSGGQPKQILITNPNSIRQNCTTASSRNQFSTITYKTANGIPTTANGTIRFVTTQAAVNAQIAKHPAPLPDSGPCDTNPNWKLPPPAPSLKISKVASGIVLSWNMTLSEKHAEIVSYQLFAYQEVNGTPPSTLLWKKVGDVMALPLPMACTLTQFSAGNNYYFAVRAVDSHSRLGQYSLPGNISL